MSTSVVLSWLCLFLETRCVGGTGKNLDVGTRSGHDAKLRSFASKFE